MKQTPMVSVLMTSFNREKYIAEAIKSVLIQSFDNFELIIIDDCSIDCTLEIAKSFDDNRIRVYQNNVNLGQFLNRNKAASLARGKYLKYVDSDDLIYENCLELFVNSIEGYEDVYLSSCLYNTKLLNEVDVKLINSLYLESVEAFKFHYEFGGVLFAGPTATIYERRAFLRIGGFNDNLGINADVDLNMKLCALGSRVGFVENCIFWRKHAEQIDIQQSDTFRMIRERYLIDVVNLSQLDRNLFPKNKINLWFSIVCRNIGRSLLRQFFKGQLRSVFYVFFSVPHRIRIISTLFIPTFILNRLFSSFKEDIV